LIGGKQALSKALPLKLVIERSFKVHVRTTKIVPGDVGRAPSQENKRVEEKSTRTTLV
jgi:hypothetical protein